MRADGPIGVSEHKWTVKGSETLVSNRWIKVRRDSVDLPNGTHIDDFYAVTISHCSAILALDRDCNVILKSEYRYCYDRDLVETPAGTFEPEESDGFSVAKRELLEETGYTSDDWTYLGPTVESSSKLTNYMHVYLAKNCVRTGGQKLDETEMVDVIVMPLSEAVEKVMNNEICCNSSASAILKAARIMGI